jgi:hypothetical protein
MSKIKEDIMDFYKNKVCCSCGSENNILCVYKNDLYNNIYKLDFNNQTIDDFMSLCKNCYNQKEKAFSQTLETGKRYGATNIPRMKPFEIDYVYGNENFDKNDINTLVGTFWYDPVKFNEKIYEKLKSK